MLLVKLQKIGDSIIEGYQSALLRMNVFHSKNCFATDQNTAVPLICQGIKIVTGSDTGQKGKALNGSFMD